MKTAEESIAEFFQSSVYQRAELTTQEGKRIPFAVVLAEVVSQAQVHEFKTLLKQLKFAGEAPDFICLAPSIDSWLDDMKVGPPVTTTRSTGDAAGPLTQQTHKISDNAANLVFLAGIGLYKPITDTLKPDYNISAINLTFSFFKLINRLKIETLVQCFSLAMLTEQYLKKLRTTDGIGNSVLVGYSFGGFIALEVARMLVKFGYRAPLVIMLDTVKPESTRVRPIGKIKGHLIGLRRDGINHIETKLMNLNKRIKALRAKYMPNNIKFSLGEYYVDREVIRRAYDSQPYDGNVLLIRTSSREHYMPKEFDYGWSDKIANLKVVKLKGDHNEFIRNQYRAIANTISGAVEEHCEK